VSSIISLLIVLYLSLLSIGKELDMRNWMTFQKHVRLTHSCIQGLITGRITDEEQGL